MISPRQTTSKRLLTEKIKRKQELFQVDNDVPVYIKGGSGDKILLGITTLLVGIGMIGSMQTAWRLITK